MTFQNKLLQLAAQTRYLLGIKPKPFEIPYGYKCVYYDTFSSLANWNYGMPWGNIHPDSPNVILDNPDVVSVDNHILSLTNCDADDKFYVANIYLKKPYKYGIFSCEILSPTGESNWPAFWLFGKNSWPPEIDIVEQYTKNGKINKFEPNVWYNEKQPSNIGAYNIPLDPTKWHDYTLVWTPDIVEIYYDGYKVCVDDKHVPNDEMWVVLDNHLKDPTITYDTAKRTPMKVKNLRIYKQC